MTLTVFDVATKQAKTIEGSTADTRLASAGGWSRDGKHFLYTQTTPEGQALFVADIDAATARRLTGPSINYQQGGCTWTAGNAPALCLMFPAGRAAQEPTQPYVDVSAGVEDGCVRIAVRDYGQWRERVPSMDRGRGSTLMSAVGEITATPSPEGTTVVITSAVTGRWTARA